MTRVLLFLMLCFLGIFRQEDVSIISAESQQWYGGIKPAGKGVNYLIILKTHKSSEKLQIDQLWIDNKQYDLEVSKPGIIGKLEQFKKKEIIHLHAREKFFKNEEGNWKLLSGYQLQEKPPIPYERAALIGYLLNNKRKYKVLDSFHIKEKQYNP